ncbi:MAG: hypothetical protein H0W73_08550 [Bacteroidetes bacterium]|nr:hypothetical protein [Bacteroidota bacterium]
MKLVFCFLLFCLTPFDQSKCLDFSHTKFVSVNCTPANCFRILSACKFNKFKINISTREGIELLKFESKTGDIEEVNVFMNNLRTEPAIESGTYEAKFEAYTYMDTTVNIFIFGLFKK